jgi:hypothetical protein
MRGECGELTAPRAEEVTMAYASQVLPSPTIRLPHVAMPTPRWPHISPGIRALLMIGLMISPAFVCDYIGYGIKRLTYTPAQIAEMRPPDDTILAHVEIFQVACPDTATPPAEQLSQRRKTGRCIPRRARRASGRTGVSLASLA